MFVRGHSFMTPPKSLSFGAPPPSSPLDVINWHLPPPPPLPPPPSLSSHPR